MRCISDLRIWRMQFECPRWNRLIVRGTRRLFDGPGWLVESLFVCVSKNKNLFIRGKLIPMLFLLYARLDFVCSETKATTNTIGWFAYYYYCRRRIPCLAGNRHCFAAMACKRLTFFGSGLSTELGREWHKRGKFGAKNNDDSDE